MQEIDPSSIATGSQLTERALSTMQGDDPVVAPRKECGSRKSRSSIMSDDDDDATFDAEVGDFGDRCGMWRK